MNIEVTSLTNTRKSLVVSFDASEVDAEHKKIVARFASQASLPGFRPGKAPVAIVAKRFAEDIRSELATALTQRAYTAGSEQGKLKILGVVKADAGVVAVGTPAKVTLEVDLQPEFTLPEYKGLTLNITPVNVTEGEVDLALDAIRRERSDFTEVERASAAGDYVKIKYVGTTGGKPVDELVPDRKVYGSMEQTWEEAGTADSLIPGLGEGIVGLAKGDKRTITVTFPENFMVEALRNLTAEYAVEALEVRERKLPEINEEFLKALGVATAEELRAGVRNRIESQKRQNQEAAKREQATKAIASAISTEFPEDLIENETQQMLRRFIQENLRRGVPQEEFEKRKEELHANARIAAVDRLKVQFALGRIAEQEKITVSQEDLIRVVSAEAQRSNTPIEKLAKDLGKNRERLRALQNSILLDKALEFVISQGKVVEAAAA